MAKEDNICNIKCIKDYINSIVEGIEGMGIVKYSIQLSNKNNALIYDVSTFTEHETYHILLKKATAFSNITKYSVPIINNGKVVYMLSVALMGRQYGKTVKGLITIATKAIQNELSHQQYQKQIEALNERLDLQNKSYEAQTKLLNFILDNIKEMVVIMDDEERYVLLNTAAQNLIGQYNIEKLNNVYEQFELYNSEWQRISKEEDPSLLVLQGKPIKDLHVKVKTHTGEKVDICVNAIPYIDDKDRKLSIKIVDNISKCVELEELTDAYENKVQQLNTIINTISDGVCVINAEGECITGNLCKASNIFPCIAVQCKENKCQRESCNKNTSNFIISKEGGEVLNIRKYLLDKLLQGKNIKKEVFVIEKNQKKHFIQLRGKTIFNGESKVDYMVISIQDVTERKKQQLKIDYQNQFINHVIDALGTPVAVIDYPGLKHKYINNQYLEVVSGVSGKELSRDHIIDETIYDIMPREYVELVEAKLDVHNLKPTTKIVRILTAEKVERYYQTVHTPLSYGDGKIHVVTVGMDITPQIQLQKDMEILTKAKEEYFATISHELRAPIAVIESVAQMLMSDYYKDQFNDKTIKFVRKIEKNSRRLLRLVNNFLDITKAEAGYMSLNLNAIDIVEHTKSLVESILPIGHKKEIAIHFNTKCKNKIIPLDIEKYERILFNLLSNAIKFTEVQGRIEVYLEEEENHIKIGVKDNGIGIAAEELDKVFNRFYRIDHVMRRPQEGTGIGLSLVKKLVELMDGRIEAKSIEEQGSEFIFYLPKGSASNKPYHENATVHKNLDKDLEEKIFLEFGEFNI